MRDCPNVEIRDLLPDFVHRTLADDAMARVTAHVASCADCRAEVALLRSAAAALRTRPAVNVAAIVRALPAPSGAPPRLVLEGREGTVERPIGGRPPLLRRARWAAVAAAAAVIAVVTARGPATTADETASVAQAVDSVRPSGPGGAAAAPAAPVAGSQPAQLAMSLAGGPVDLTDSELEALLGDLETIDAMPSEEPEEPADPLREGGEDAR